MDKQVMWVFGPSMCLPYDIESKEAGWPSILSSRLGVDCKNFSREAADNLVIYSSYKDKLPYIKDNDIVVIGWSHPNRKSFVVDRTNPRHLDVIDNSFVYTLSNIELMRNRLPINMTLMHWSKLLPKKSGSKFYDTWFENYFSSQEQSLHLQCYHDSVALTCPAKYVAFAFSEESVSSVNINPAGYMLEFVLNNQVAISKENLHLNEQGHKMWADHLYGKISNS